MAASCSFVRGRVVTDGSHDPVVGADVDLTFSAGRRKIPLVRIATGLNGEFVIDLRAAALGEGIAGSGRFTLKVFRGGVELTIKGGRSKWSRGTDPGEVLLCVEVPETCEPDLAAPPTEIGGSGAGVLGRVFHHDGGACAGVVVHAYDFQISGESASLASDTTDAEGWYGITLPALPPGDPERNVFVRAFTPGPSPVLLGSSKPRFGVAPPVRIDLEICSDDYRTPCEWVRNDTSLQAERGTLPYAEIGETQTAFLVGRTGIDAERVGWWLQAHLLRIELDLGVDHVAEAVYGLQYGRLPPVLRTLHGRGGRRISDALELALRDNIIRTAAALLSETLIAGLAAWRLARFLDGTNPDSLTALFSASGLLNATQVTEIVSVYASYDGPRDQFWAAVSDMWPMTPAAVDEAKRLVTLAGLAYAHAPSVVAITTAIANGAASVTATLTAAQWLTLVGTIPALPDGIDGDNDAERRVNYAAWLRANAQAGYPGTAVGSLVRLDTSGTIEPVKSFATRNAAFDFERSDVLSTWALSGTDPDGERAEVAAFQRMYRIAPTSDRFVGAKAMYDAGLRSSHAISRRGSKRSIKQLKDAGMTESDARLTVAKASQASAKALTLFTQAHSNLTGVRSGDAVWPNGKGSYSRFLPAEDVDTSSIASWEALFGNVDYCTCLDCRSITGPAAYFVDMLHWLDDREGWSGTGKLRERRPDLGLILMNCENTTRVLPYIDLALEVLENAAALEMTPPLGITQPYTTDAEGAELLAGSQYVNHEVYDALSTIEYPMSLPFHQPLAEARAFLRHLGVERTDLKDAFQHPTSGPTDSAIAMEELGLFSAARDLITTDGDPDERDRWGIALAIDWPDLIRDDVEEFLDRAGISYPELLDLLHTRYVNARDLPSLTGDILLEYDDACDLDTFNFASTSGAAWNQTFGRIRQLLRLRRASGWTFLDLDKVLDAFGTTAIAVADVDSVGGIHRLQREIGLSPVELAAWFAPIDAWDDRDNADSPVPSLYESVFLNPSVFPTNDRTDLTTTAYKFVLNTTTFEPNGAAEDLEDYKAEIQALLGIDAASFDAIYDWIFAAIASSALTRANLSAFYRWTSLSRIVGLSVDQTIALSDLSGSLSVAFPDLAFGSANLAREFIQEVRELGEAGLSVDDVLYVLLHDVDAAARVAVTETWLQDALARLGDKLTAHFQAPETPLADPGQVQLTALLDDILVTGSPVRHPTYDSFDITRAMLDAVIAGTYPDPGTGFYPDPGILSYTALQTAILQAALEGHCDLPDFSVRLAALAVPLNSATTGDAEEVLVRQLWAAQRLIQWQAAEAVVVAHFAKVLALPASALEALRGNTFERLASGMSTPSEAFGDWVDTYLHAAFRGAGLGVADPTAIERGPYDVELELAEILSKFALLVSRLELDEDEIAFWVSAASDAVDVWKLYSPFDLAAAAPTASMTTPCALLKRLGEIARLRNRIPGTEPTFASLLTAANDWDATALANFGTSLALRTTWSATDIAAIVTDLALATLGTRERVDVLHQLLDALAIVRRTGSDGATVAGWKGVMTSTESKEVVLAARSRYSTSAGWAGVARPVRDQLRKVQRDALVAYLITRPGSDIRDADDLYGDLLIDAQMNPEMLTARLKQATCSVQLYVQRNMVGIESEVDFNEDDRAEWEWMKNYRVWEAARKVFLYPENWIEPELRDDKSPFFKSLESELSQDDITDARVEDATLAYLDRLDEVAHPEVLAYFVQRETVDDGGEAEATIDVLHVFARSRGLSPTYWYRRWEDQSTWTAWEKVECGVEGKHLVPVVFERRLTLYWFILGEEGNDDETFTPNPWYSIRLAWSEYRDGKWQAKNEAEDALSMQNEYVGSTAEDGSVHASWRAKDEFHFLSSEEDGTLIIRCVCWSECKEDWYAVGRFELDPCTRVIEAIEQGTEDEDGDVHLEKEQLMARVDGSFLAPGYIAYNDSQRYLAVSLGSWDDDLVLIENSEVEKRLLDQLLNACVVFPTQFKDYVSQVPFFVNAADRTFFVVKESASYPTSEDSSEPDLQTVDQGAERAMNETDSEQGEEETFASSWQGPGLYRFDNFYHPFVCRFIKEARREGLVNLYAPSEAGASKKLSRQQLERDEDYFENTFMPTENVKTPYPFADIDFERGGAYSLYNWELFFHVPFYVANRLTDNQRFEDALRWYSYIFDPLDRGTGNSQWEDAPERFWKIKPFLEPVSAPVTDWVAFTGADGDDEDADSFERQVEEWRDDPFNPHMLARLRPGTYQKSVVMRYIDNLVGWGDQLFTRDTIETLNEAMQLYVLAGQILGDRPEKLSKPTKPVDKNFDDLLAAGLDSFSNAEVTSPVIWLEGLLRSGRWDPLSSTPMGKFRLSAVRPAPLVGTDTYFCIPPNPKLLAYWDTVEDRLFKIRNSLNIEGVFRSLPLYEPPIDPALLVRASAAGVDLGTVLSDLSVPLPNHRFSTMVGRAQALTSSVKALGGAILSAIEKRDAEALALLRAGHEIAVLNMVRQSKELAIEEARESLAASRNLRKTTQARHDYYKGLVAKGWLSGENWSAILLQTATGLEGASGIFSMLGGVLGVVPDTHVSPTCPAAVVGGAQITRVMGGLASGAGALAAIARGESSYLSTVAGYTRRAQEWTHQQKLAAKEMKQLDKQILAAEIRVAIAKHDLRTHAQQTRQSEEVKSWMESKYSNQELYAWMVNQVSATYYQSYQLAYQVAKRAQRCYAHELGRDDTFINAAYWDNSRKGLLAGEQLGYDLERLDIAYLENDKREFEITRNISLSLLDGLAIASLMTQGQCYFELPEALFDLDYPGHYFRRIQSMSVSISCVGGSPGGITGTLTLYRTRTRTSASLTGDYDAVTLSSDSRTESIALSTGMNDAGLFQMDLRDARYLPFERRGAISDWALKLTGSDDNAPKQFDWSTISEVTLTLRYTAREGGSSLADEAWSSDSTTLLTRLNAVIGGNEADPATSTVTGLQRVFSAKRHFPDAWYQTTQTTGTLAFSEAISKSLFPYFAQAGTIKTTTIRLYLLGTTTLPTGAGTLKLNSVDATTLTAWTLSAYGVPYVVGTWTATEISFADMTLALASYTFASPSALDDLLIAIDYDLT